MTLLEHASRTGFLNPLGLASLLPISLVVRGALKVHREMLCIVDPRCQMLYSISPESHWLTPFPVTENNKYPFPHVHNRRHE